MSFGVFRGRKSLLCASAENREVNERDDTETEEKRISLQVANLEQTQKRAESPRAAARAADRAGIDDPPIEKC